MCASATAGSLTFDYENFQRTPNGAAEIVLKFTNGTDRTIKYVGADCALLDKDGKAITVIPVMVDSIGPGETAYAHNYGPPHDTRIAKADCRLKG
jgi:hypothetical protein